MCAYKVTFELRIVGRSAGKWNFLLYDIKRSVHRLVRLICCKMIAIVSNTVGWLDYGKYDDDD